MKSMIVVVCVLACAYAYSQDKEANVVRSDFQNSPEGNYQHSFESDNGISQSATGSFKRYGEDSAAVVVSGSHQYVNPEGETVQFTYVADENGYQPQGSHLPTPPPPQPIPDYILRAIEYIKAHPYVEPTTGKKF